MWIDVVEVGEEETRFARAELCQCLVHFSVGAALIDLQVVLVAE